MKHDFVEQFNRDYPKGTVQDALAYIETLSNRLRSFVPDYRNVPDGVKEGIYEFIEFFQKNYDSRIPDRVAKLWNRKQPFVFTLFEQLMQKDCDEEKERISANLTASEMKKVKEFASFISNRKNFRSFTFLLEGSIVAYDLDIFENSFNETKEMCLYHCLKMYNDNGLMVMQEEKSRFLEVSGFAIDGDGNFFQLPVESVKVLYTDYARKCSSQRHGPIKFSKGGEPCTVVRNSC